MACVAVSGSVVVVLGAGPGPAPPAAGAGLAPRRGCAAPGACPPSRGGAASCGAVAPAPTVRADVVLKPRDPAALEAFDAAVSTPGSPVVPPLPRPRRSSPGAFGPSPATIASVRGWLAGRGLARRPDVGRRPHRPGLGHRRPRSTGPSPWGSSSTACRRGGWCASPTPSRSVPERAGRRLYGVTGLDDLEPARARAGAARPGAPAPAAGAGRTAAAPRRRRPAPRAAGPTPTAGCEATIQSGGRQRRRADRRPAGRGVLVLEPLPRQRGLGRDRGRLRARAVPRSPTSPPSRPATRRPSRASVTAVGVDGARPNAGPGAGRGGARHRDGHRHGPERERQGLRRAQRRERARSTPTRRWSTTTAARGDLHQLGPVRGAAAAGVHPGRGVDLRAGRGPGPDRRRRGRATRDPRTATSSRAPTDTRLAGRRPGRPALGDRRGGDHARRPRARPHRVGVELGPVHRHRRGRDLDDVDHAGVAARPRVSRAPFTKAQDTFTGAQPCPVSSGAGTVSCREVPDVAADADPRTGLRHLLLVCQRAGGRRSGGRAWPRPCGQPWRRWPTRASRRRWAS